MTDDTSPLVKALAATDPADLIQAVIDRLDALALQHDALRLLTLDSLKGTTSCRCRSCCEASGALLSTLQEIDGWKPPAEEYVEEMMKDISGVLNTEYLEQLYRREG